jgi:hypothetical protein
MEPSFQEWLTAHEVPPKLLKTLTKEDVTNAATLKALNDADLEKLKKKHKLPMGHVVTLRAARDELAKGDSSHHQMISRPGVERETGQQAAPSPVLSPPPHPARGKEPSQPRRMGEEIRSKYQLPVRDDRYSRRNASRSGASAAPGATPSPLPEAARTPTPRGGAVLQAAAQMQDIHRRAVERGEKIAAVEQKSREFLYPPALAKLSAIICHMTSMYSSPCMNQFVSFPLTPNKCQD